MVVVVMVMVVVGGGGDTVNIKGSQLWGEKRWRSKG